MRWYLLTGEYPPASGGVADYTRHVAEGLAARGESVQVFVPAPPATGAASAVRNGVTIRWLPGGFGWRGLRFLEHALDGQPAGGRLLVQYVPHAFGWKAMNLPLCRWLAWQRRHALWIMFHEVAYPCESGQLWRHALLARVNRVMARWVADAAERILVSTSAWRSLLVSIQGREVPVTWAPIPSNFEAIAGGRQPLEPAALFPGRWRPGDRLLGHFGTFGSHIVDLLHRLVPAVLEHRAETRLLLVGRGSSEFAAHLDRALPTASGRVVGVGAVEPAAVVDNLRACDLLMQPFPDGVSTRRTSAMGGLALGLPIVTHAGTLTEPIWAETAAVRLVRDFRTDDWVAAVQALLDLPTEREQLAIRARECYWKHFSLENTLRLLLA